MAAALLSTSALSSMEAMLNSLMGRPSTQGGGDDIDTVTDRDDALDLPLPPLPVRPAAPRGRRPSRPQRFVAAAEPSSPSPLEEESIGEEASALAELERKATMAEARLRQKEEENAALRRRIESYHVRWLEYEFKIKSMEETFHEQMASLQMARDSAEMRRKRQEHYAEPPHTKTSEEASARLRHGGRSSARRSSAVGRLGEEFRRQSQSLESGAVGRLGAEFRRQSQSLQSGAAAAVVVGGDARPPQWQPGAPSANGDSEEDELIRLKARFRAWKKDYKVRLRKAKAEIDKERRRRSSCWIPRF